MKTITKTLSAGAALALSAMLVTGCGADQTADAASSATISAAADFHSDKPSADGKGFYAPINGMQIYYEIHGTGAPLVLLHGGLSTADATFGALLPELAKTRKVVSVELQAHGHTADIDRPLRYETMADDVASLITHLGLGQADVLGYSLGGGVALQLAARTPTVVDKLVVASAPYRSDGWLPETRAGMAAMNPGAMLDSPMHALYAQTAPKPGDWPALVDKTRTLLGADYDWTSQIAAIKAPTLLVSAESDALYREHVIQFAGLLAAGSRLEIIPGTTHYDLMYRADLLLPLIAPFLDAPTSR
ncbi:alpha/beta hydrolase [Nocardia sp. NPDC050710]|uniref:alpha/beta fold hydrolase n=1 Tax=Nocardia sp. NPDC050710 TaxID=3157220 RepID=UPI0033CB1FCB